MSGGVATVTYIYDPGQARKQSINGKRKEGRLPPHLGSGVALDTFFKKRVALTAVTRNFLRVLRKITPLVVAAPPPEEAESCSTTPSVLNLFWSSHRERLHLPSDYNEWLKTTDVVHYLEFIKN